MDQELQELGDRVERVLSIARRLADENAGLRDQLAAARAANEQLQQRIAEARARVENALSRLPEALLGDSEAGQQPDAAAPSAANDSPTP